MPALAIPIGAPFEVAPDKVTEFLEFSRKMNSREITESRLKKMNAQVQFISKKTSFNTVQNRRFPNLESVFLCLYFLYIMICSKVAYPFASFSVRTIVENIYYITLNCAACITC